MRKAFGKPIGVAARVETGTVVLELHVKAADLQKGKDAIHAAKAKLPMLTEVRVVEVPKAPAEEEEEEEEEDANDGASGSITNQSTLAPTLDPLSPPPAEGPTSNSHIAALPPHEPKQRERKKKCAALPRRGSRYEIHDHPQRLSGLGL